jgi:ketosteroid isomerase-like protein
MSQENVELVRKALDTFNAFARGELEASGQATEQLSSDFADPEVEQSWHDERTMPDQPQHLRGAPEIIGFWEQLRSAWVDLSLEPLEFIEAPNDRVLTPTRQSGRGRESGIPIVTHLFVVWTIRAGKVRKLELFRHRTDALEAAGLRE